MFEGFVFSLVPQPRLLHLHSPAPTVILNLKCLAFHSKSGGMRQAVSPARSILKGQPEPGASVAGATIGDCRVGCPFVHCPGTQYPTT